MVKKPGAGLLPARFIPGSCLQMSEILSCEEEAEPVLPVLCGQCLLTPFPAPSPQPQAPAGIAGTVGLAVGPELCLGP